MGIALQKRVMAGLSGLFLLASLGAGPSEAAPKQHKPRATTPAKAKKPAVNNACVQTASNAFAESLGYSSVHVMRRASALAHLREKSGQDTNLLAAIAAANKDTNADFDLMVMVATIESTFGEHDAPLLGGGARGPFQYLGAPFLTLFNWFGAEFEDGYYARAASQIKFDEQKNPYTDDPEVAQKILELRSETFAAAFIKGVEIMKDERPLLRAVLGREPTRTDYYVAHLFGLERAKTLFRALRTSPKMPAADIFAKEADNDNNRPLFYKKNRKLSVREVYSNLGALTNRVALRIQQRVQEGLADKSCLQPLPINRPARSPIQIRNDFRSSPTPGPQRPDINMPIEPDAITNPVPEPAPIIVPEPPAFPDRRDPYGYGS